MGAQLARRELLGWSALLVAGRPWLGFLRSRPAADEVQDLVQWIRTTPREPALARGARELRAGLDPARLLGALLLASAREIRTDLPRFNHAALSVSAIDQLARSAPAAERQRTALWCLDYFKEAQEMEAGPDDWRMPPVDAQRLPAGAAARAALVDALERWDRDAADAAIAGWVRSAPLDEVFDLVFEYGTRCATNLGHKAIYAALARRALPLLGEPYAEDVLRSVVASFFLDGPTAAAAPFEQSRGLVGAGIAPRAPRPAADLGPTNELLAELRGSAPEELPPVVARLLADGASPPSLWDAVVAAAAEVTVASPGIGSLHALTSANALRHIALAAEGPRLAQLAQLALLQAAAWGARFRGKLDAEARAFRLDALEPAPSSVEALLQAEAGSAPRVREALWLGGEERLALEVMEGAQRVTRAKADDVHEFKLSAAAIEEARRVSPWVRPWVCAALAVHLPAEGREDGAQAVRIAGALAVAGAGAGAGG